MLRNALKKLGLCVVAFGAFAHTICLPESAAAAPSQPRRISASTGKFLEISTKFNGKSVSCRLMPNGVFEAGFVTRKNGNRFWNDIDTIKAVRANNKRGRNLRTQRNTAQTRCIQRARTVCNPTLSAMSVAVVENQPATFQPSISNSCGLPLTLVRAQDPAVGAITVDADSLVTYIPANHFVGTDSARLAITSSLGRQEQSVTFTVGPRGFQFAGDPNSLLPYRETLTQAEVDSLLKRVGMGGNDSLRSIRSLSALVDALLSTQETPEALVFSNAKRAEVAARVNQGPNQVSPRWSIWDVNPLFINDLRYGQPLMTWLTANVWMNHFATDISQQSNGGAHESMVQHLDFLKSQASGNFETMLTGLVRRILVPSYLNGYDNSNAQPNQNLPREFLELFTAGVVDPITKEQNYHEQDVASMTEIFGGLYYQPSALGFRTMSGGISTPVIYYASDDDATLPTNVAPEDCARQTANRVEIRWFSMDGAGNFARVQRAPLGSSTFTTLGEVSRWANIFHDVRGCGQATNLQPAPGQVYQYRIQFVSRANNDPNSAVVAEGPFSAVETGYFAGNSTPTIPANQTATTNLPDRIRISWSAAAGATSYRIFRIQYDAAYDDHFVGETSSTSFDDMDIRPNKTYLYYVRAYNSSTRLLSPHPNRFLSYRNTDFVAGYSLLPNQPMIEYPQISFATMNQTDRVTLTWSPVPGAAGYRVIARPAWVEMPVRLADLPANTTSYVDTSTARGFQRHYTIIPFDNAGRLSGFAGQSGQVDSRYLRSVQRTVGNGIVTDLLRPQTTFLEWLPDDDSNVGGRVLGDGNGEYLSIFGQDVYERINWQPVQRPTESIINHVLYNWPATSRNIAAKLFASMAHRQISEPIVHELAEDLRTNRYDLRATIRKILMSSASFAPESNGTCIMNPAEAIMTFLRTSGLPVSRDNTRNAIYTALVNTNHNMLTPPSVFGFTNCGLVRSGAVHDGSQWLASNQTYVALGNGISSVLQWITSSGGENTPLLTHFVGTTLTSADVVVDRVATKLRIDLNLTQRSLLVDYLNRNASEQTSLWSSNLSANERAQRMAGLVRLMVMTVNFLSK